MINVLLQGLFGVASSAVEGYVETKKAKAKQKLVAIEAETTLMQGIFGYTGASKPDPRARTRFTIRVRHTMERCFS